MKEIKTLRAWPLVIIAAAMLSLSSCGGLESKARKQVKETLLDMAKNPETFKISNVKTVVANDSLVILHLRTNGQNGLGGYSTTRMEYIYLVNKGKDGELRTYESVYDIEDESKPANAPMRRQAREFIKDHEKSFDRIKRERGLDDAQMLDDVTYTLSLAKVLFHGREVGEDD